MLFEINHNTWMNLKRNHFFYFGKKKKKVLHTFPIMQIKSSLKAAFQEAHKNNQHIAPRENA